MTPPVDTTCATNAHACLFEKKKKVFFAKKKEHKEQESNILLENKE